MAETIRFYICAFFMTIGVLFEITAVFGVFRFKYVMNRMHAAAIGDTMGLFFIVFSLIIAIGVDWQSLKLLLLVMVFWMTSPVSSHMIARLELETNEDLSKEAKVWTR